MRTHVLFVLVVLIQHNSALNINFKKLKNRFENSKKYLKFKLPESKKMPENATSLEETLKKAHQNLKDNREQVIEDNLKAHLKGDNFIETMANMGAAMVIQSEIETLKKNLESDDLSELLEEKNVKLRTNSRWNILCNAIVIGENKLEGDGKLLEACNKLKNNIRLSESPEK